MTQSRHFISDPRSLIVDLMRNRPLRLAMWSLLLLVPAPTLGTVAGMALSRGQIGQSIYLASKVWLAVFPLVWLLLVERVQLECARPTRRGLGVGAMLGLGISVSIVGGCAVVGRSLIDADQFRTLATRNGFGTLERYLVFCLYIVCVNALIEEYVWRWFVVRQWQVITTAALHGWLSVILSAGCFTIHHVVALALQFPWPIVLIGSAGVFVGGVVWSWCYVRFGSIWPGYVSHAIVDVAVFAVGWDLLFQ